MAYSQGTASASGSGYLNLFTALRTFTETTLGWTLMQARSNFFISTITFSGTTATVTTLEPHDLVASYHATISGCTGTNASLYNVTNIAITYISTTSFSYTMSGTPTANAVGTLLGVNIELPRKTVIWMATGLSGTENIYMGVQTYGNVSGGQYCWNFSTFTGFISTNSFTTQPGYVNTGSIPLWAGSIPYTFIGNAQRIIVYAQISGTDQSMYLGKILPYATPSQWPYPVCVGGMLLTPTYTLYSDTTQIAWFKGSRNNLGIRNIAGTWIQPIIPEYTGTSITRNTKSLSTATETTIAGTYCLRALVLVDDLNAYGELDGAYFISGFSNTTGNTLVVGGITYLVIADNTRSGYKDYVALRLS